MTVAVAVAGVTGWTGSAVVRGVLKAQDLTLAAAVARRAAGQDVGLALGLEAVGLPIAPSVSAALGAGVDVLVDYTGPNVVKGHVLEALQRGAAVVVGTSGLTSDDYDEIDRAARAAGRGVIAAGNFSLTAALAKHFALEASRHIPSWEIVDYADAHKVDAPSGTARELAEELGRVRASRLEVAIDETFGSPEARGARIGETQVHSLRLPSYTIAFEAIFGLPDERLTIRHDAGSGAEPYVGGTLLAVRRVGGVVGLVRGLDRLLFDADPATA